MADSFLSMLAVWRTEAKRELAKYWWGGLAHTGAHPDRGCPTRRGFRRVGNHGPQFLVGHTGRPPWS